MPSPAQGQRALLSPCVPAQQSRFSDSHNVPRIIVEPTPDKQNAYNEIRQAHERSSLQAHVASQQTPRHSSAAPSVISTAHSHADDLGTPTSHDTAPKCTDGSKKPRGRRKGPLDAETRLRTAVKRRLKLACPHHRVKKTTCDCHDFVRLEEGYQTLLQQSVNRSPRDRHDVPPLTPTERASNLQTFGAGGAAMASPDIDTTLNDVNDILYSPNGDREDVVRPNVRDIVSGFDPTSPHLDGALLHAPVQLYLPGNVIGTPQSPRGHTQNELLEIGSQMRDFPLRWHCEYKGGVDSASVASSEVCSWTGPIRQLSDHFRAEHHPFQDASPPLWLVCTACGAKTQCTLESPISSSPCVGRGCSSTSIQRWYYGSMRAESVEGSVLALTQSSESEAGFSWNPQLEENQAWLGGGGSNNKYFPYSGAGNSHERPNSYDTKSDISSGSSNRFLGSGRYSQDCLPNPHTRKCCVEWQPPGVGAEIPRKATQLRSAYRQFSVGMPSSVKLPISHLAPIMLPLLATILREGGYIVELHPLPFRGMNADMIRWWSLGLLILGFMMTWAFKDWGKSRVAEADEGIPRQIPVDGNARKSDYRAGGSQRPGELLPFKGVSIWRYFDALTLP
ncbi:hypothetical protein AAE478_008528 [Parahypoxylon ruwenzoriense]